MNSSKLSCVSAGIAAVLAVGCGSAEDDGRRTQAPAYEYEAQCGIQTEFGGDELCLGQPEPEVGFQLHYGPSNYADPDEVARFTLAPGEELTDCLYLTTPNDSEVFWHEYHLRARTGTHHLIVYAGSDVSAQDGTLADCNQGADMRFFVGAQSGLSPDGVRLDVPLPGERVTEENEGYAQRLGPNTRVAFQAHYVNTSNEPILREAWVNFHYLPARDVKVVMEPIFFIGGLNMSIAPGTEKAVVEAESCTIPENGPDEVRIMGVSAHMHAHGRRFSAYKVDTSGARQLFYQTFDWEEPLNAQFDSGHDNPPLDAAGELEGAWSGLFTLKRGESISYECEYYNDLETPLEFGDKAYTGEMCNLFGWYAPSMGEPWSCYRM